MRFSRHVIRKGQHIKNFYKRIASAKLEKEVERYEEERGKEKWLKNKEK